MWYVIIFIQFPLLDSIASSRCASSSRSFTRKQLQISRYASRRCVQFPGRCQGWSIFMMNKNPVWIICDAQKTPVSSVRNRKPPTSNEFHSRNSPLDRMWWLFFLFHALNFPQQTTKQRRLARCCGPWTSVVGVLHRSPGDFWGRASRKLLLKNVHVVVRTLYRNDVQVTFDIFFGDLAGLWICLLHKRDL